MKPTTIITLLAAWIWAFQGCDNKHRIREEAGLDNTSSGTITVHKQSQLAICQLKSFQLN